MVSEYASFGTLVENKADEQHWFPLMEGLLGTSSNALGIERRDTTKAMSLE